MTANRKAVTVRGPKRLERSGALIRPCPKCGAPVGHRCRNMRDKRGAGAAEPKLHPHLERRSAGRGNRHLPKTEGGDAS